MNPPSPPDVDEHRVDTQAARQMLLDAAQFCGWCTDYWRDEGDLKSGRMQIHYAIDVDVVKLYTDPQTKQNYGQVFSQAGEVSDIVAGLVGDYVLHRLMRPEVGTEAVSGGTAHQLILIPPHGAELKRVAEAISSDQSEASAKDLDRFRKETQALRKQMLRAEPEQQSDVFLTFLASHASELHNLLLGRVGAAAEMAKLNMLPARRLVGLSGHPAFSGEAPLRTPPPRNGTDVDSQTMLALSDKWYELMLTDLHDITPHKRSKIDDDAWVLASLEWINADAAVRGLRQRLVLITGTQRIHAAAVRRAALHDGFPCFRDAYLRDPRCFMGAKDFFSGQSMINKGDTHFRILEWMSMLFPHSIRQQRTQSPSDFEQPGGVAVEADLLDVREIVNGTAVSSALEILTSEGYQQRQEQGKSFPNGALEEWREVVRDTNAQVVLKRQQDAQSKVLAGMLNDLPNSGDARFEHLLDRLAERMQQSFSGLYLATGVIGVEQLLECGVSIRGLPALRFDLPEYEVAQAQCDALSDELFNEKGRRATFDLAHMYEELADTDQSHYHAHVLHAFVYASAERWFSARTLCRVALLVVDAIPTPKARRRTGREAAYLMAIAERRLAVNEDGLRLAEAALMQARDRAQGDEKFDVRFDSEMLAQNLTSRQLAYFVRGNPVAVIDPLPLMNEALQLCERATKGEEARTVRRWVVRQAVTNGLLAGLMAVDAGQRKPQTVGLARTLIKVLEVEKLAPSLGVAVDSQLYSDGISDFIWLVAVAVFENLPRSALGRELLGHRGTPVYTQGVLAFELERHERFMRLAGIDPKSNFASPVG